MDKQSTKVLAAASGGGHWEQLMLLRGTLEKYDVTYATTEKAVAAQHGVTKVQTLPDCNQNRPFASLWCALVALRILLRVRPAVVISTGAAPGFFCILFGRAVGARTLWIDSVANGDELSMCGKLSVRFAHECLTQWAQLSNDRKPKYRGAIL